MVCIYCAGKTQVSNSRHQTRRNTTWRRRTCQSCTAIFSTVERPDLDQSIMVCRTTHLQPFVVQQLFCSLYDSLRHRPTAIVDATALTDTITPLLLHESVDGVVNRDTIVYACVDVLKRFDAVAATMYTAYHPVAYKK